MMGKVDIVKPSAIMQCPVTVLRREKWMASLYAPGNSISCSIWVGTKARKELGIFWLVSEEQKKFGNGFSARKGRTQLLLQEVMGNRSPDVYTRGLLWQMRFLICTFPSLP